MPDTNPVSYIDGITRRYTQLGYEPYRWFTADTTPAFTPLKKTLAESRLGILSTAGAYVPGQIAFHYRDDTSIRTVARDTPEADLRFAHITENYLVDARKDGACMLPLSALAAAQQRGKLGEVTEETISCMGGIYSQRRVRDELIPAVEAELDRQQPDALLLLPL